MRKLGGAYSKSRQQKRFALRPAKTGPCSERYAALYLAALLLISSQSFAQIYKWVDSDGNIHYGDAENTPESAKSKEVELGDINTITSVTYGNVIKPQDTVVLYSTSWCGYCEKARNYFRAKGIPFT